MSSIESKISEFLKKQVEAQKLAKKKEKVQVCIKPDSYIGREIEYQTALLHEILSEIRIRNSKGSDKTAGNSAMENITVNIEVDTTEIEGAIEKANKLAELLREVQQILNSLFETSRSET